MKEDGASQRKKKNVFNIWSRIFGGVQCHLRGPSFRKKKETLHTGVSDNRCSAYSREGGGGGGEDVVPEEMRTTIGLARFSKRNRKRIGGGGKRGKDLPAKSKF